MHSFTNNIVDIAELPEAEEISFVPIQRAYRKIIVWEWMVGWAIVLLAAATIIFLSKRFQTYTWISIFVSAILILSSINLWLLFKTFSMKAYAVRERDLVYRSGWIVQRISICPFNRIQHCAVTAGPFERRLNLSSLSVYTAGTEGSDLKIPGLPAETANVLRDMIMKKTGIDEFH
jgi:membrane protein YdbS with pleckstrin-like domain